MRVYLAASTRQLRQLLDGGAVTDVLDGYAAADALRMEWGDDSDEELEYALSTAAAGASLLLLRAATSQVSARRVVIVADLAAEQVEVAHETPGAVIVKDGVTLERVDAVLADPADLAEEHAISDDLAWFAPQEIADLLA